MATWLFNECLLIDSRNVSSVAIGIGTASLDAVHEGMAAKASFSAKPAVQFLQVEYDECRRELFV